MNQWIVQEKRNLIEYVLNKQIGTGNIRSVLVQNKYSNLVIKSNQQDRFYRVQGAAGIAEIQIRQRVCAGQELEEKL